MKLYYAPGACSLAPHIVLNEAGFSFDIEKVNFADKKTEKGEDYNAINRKGSVPSLKLEDGQLLTEGAVIMQYLADQKPDTGLIPKAGTMERYRMMEWLNFIATEVHKSFGPLWKPDTPEATKETQKKLLSQKFDYLTNALKGKEYLTGNFSIADAYLFTVLNWANILKLDMSKWPDLQSYVSRIAARPKVQQSLKEEGLIN